MEKKKSSGGCADRAHACADPATRVQKKIRYTVFIEPYLQKVHRECRLKQELKEGTNGGMLKGGQASTMNSQPKEVNTETWYYSSWGATSNVSGIAEEEGRITTSHSGFRWQSPLEKLAVSRLCLSVEFRTQRHLNY